MQRNLFTHTDPGGNYPAFISINDVEDGRVSVTVRSTHGQTASIRLDAKTFMAMAETLGRFAQ